MKTSIPKHILFEYWSGRSNPLEKQLVEEWIRKNENSEMFYQWLLEFEVQSPQFIPDQDHAVEKLINRIQDSFNEQIDTIEEEENGLPEIPETQDTFRKIWLIAATFLLIGSCGWLFRDSILYKTYQTDYGQTTNLYLEDGSRVALNANSSLSVPRFGFLGKVREVILKGEGEFAVSHTIDHKRFVVKTSDSFQVEVLGTEFSMFARKRATKVVLHNGSVRIDYALDEKRKSMMMEPGDLAFVDKTGKVQLEKQEDAKDNATWKEHRYVFNSTSMREISSLIEENFGVQVNVNDPEIARRTITGNFKTGNAEELLKTVSEVLDLKVHTSGDSIFLTNN